MFFDSITLAIVLLSSRALAEEFSPNDAPSGKRAPMGFQGMRGKKDLTSSENGEFSKRAPMGFQGMRGKKHSEAINEDNMITPDEELEKRSPMGFQGMRGKKDLVTPVFADSYFRDEYLKRAPMGFQGMRGKKAMLDDDYHKSTLMGFEAARGVKPLDLLLGEIQNGGYGVSQGKNMYLMEYPNDYEKRARSMGFQGMRGKRREELEDEWNKRAPMGFQGMRGKKSLLEEMEDLEKRAIMGFQGMRGKKHIRSNDYDEYRPEGSVGYLVNSHIWDHKLAKRESAKLKPTGLVGMREKPAAIDSTNDNPTISQYNIEDALADEVGFKDSTNVAPLEIYKRSPYGYFGTRGKKIPRWELRRKFVGVRGKKWPSTPNYDDGNPLNNVNSNIQRIGVKMGSTTKLDNQ